MFSREDWVFGLADKVKFCRFETFCLNKKLGPDEWRLASGLVQVYEVVSVNLPKVKLPIYFELKFKVYGHWCIRNLSYAQDFTNVTLAYEDD